MKTLTYDIKQWHGAIAFVELRDDSIWEVGIIPRCKLGGIDFSRQEFKKYNLYSMHWSKKLNMGYIDSFNAVNSEIKQNDGAIVVLYGIIISENLLPLGKVELLCYKKTDGIEEFPSVE